MDKIAVAKKEMQDLVYHDEEYKKSLMERIKTWNKEAWWNRQHWIKKLYIHIKTKIMEVRNGKSRFQNSNSSNDK